MARGRRAGLPRAARYPNRLVLSTRIQPFDLVFLGLYQVRKLFSAGQNEPIWVPRASAACRFGYNGKLAQWQRAVRRPTARKERTHDHPARHSHRLRRRGALHHLHRAAAEGLRHRAAGQVQPHLAPGPACAHPGHREDRGQDRPAHEPIGAGHRREDPGQRDHHHAGSRAVPRGRHRRGLPDAAVRRCSPGISRGPPALPCPARRCRTSARRR